MELLFIFIPFAIAAIFGKKFIYDPFASGKRQIDKLKYPTLERTQRVLRAANTKKRDKEAKALENHFTSKRLAIEEDTVKRLAKSMQQSMTDHANDLHEWDYQFKALTSEEDKRRYKEAQRVIAAKKKAEDDAWQERRDRERKIWLEAEKKRLEEKPKELAHPNDYKAFQEAFDGIMAAPKETIWTVPMGDEGSSYGDRTVSVHALYTRKKPTKNSRISGNLTQYEKIMVDGWTTGEEVYNNPLWFRIKSGGSKGHSGWVWGGGLNSQSTSGLKRIDPIEDKKIGPMITANHISDTSVQFKNKDIEEADLLRVIEWQLGRKL